MKNWLSSLLTGLMALLDSRVLLLLLPALCYLYWVDAAQANTIVYSFAVVIAVAAVSHFTRKVFFPYIDLEEYATRALRDPLSAAVVFLSVTIVLCMMLYIVAAWVAR